MKKHLKKFLTLGSLAITTGTFAITTPLITNTKLNEDKNVISKKQLNSQINQQDLDPEKQFNFDLKKDQQYWFNFINEINNQSNPIAIFTRNASLVYEQSLYLAMVNYFNQSNNYLTIIQEEKFLNNPRYNLDFLHQEKIANLINLGPSTTKQLSKDKINVLFDLVNPKNPGIDIIRNNDYQPILDFIKKTGSNQKINIVMPDLSFINLFKSFNPDVNNPLIQIIAHANSLTLTSDGNAHMKYVIPDPLVKFILSKDFQKQDQQQIKKNLKAIQSLDRTAIAKLTKNDIYNLFLLKDKVYDQFDFIHFIHFDTSYQQRIFTNKVDQDKNYIELINPENQWSSSSFSVNYLDYANLIKTPEAKSNFIAAFSKLFFSDQLNKIFTSFDEKKFDWNKKTALFIGSALFTPTKANEVSRLEHLPNLRQYVQEAVAKLIKSFPEDEYNLVFKHHPLFPGKHSVELTKIYTDNKIKVPNVINSQIPLETLLTTDYQNALNNQKSIFFKKYQNQIKPKFLMFGLQASTTTIQTTKVFLESTLNYSPAASEQFVSLDKFPIPSTFDVIARTDTDNNVANKLNSNKNQILQLYKYFNPSFHNKNIDHKFDRLSLENLQSLDEVKELPKLKDDLENSNPNQILMISLITITLIILITATPLTIYFIKKKKSLN